MRINISLDERSLKELDRQAKEENRNRSEQLRELIKIGKNTKGLKK